jgi:hypothetical protein
VKGSIPSHHHAHQAEVHIEDMCATERSRRMISQMLLWTLIEAAVGCPWAVASAQEVRSTR